MRDAWATAGVYTLAAQFGDDGSKSGEIETSLQIVDREAFEEAKRSVDTKKGGRVGAAFAAKVAPPTAVVDLWAAIRNHLIGAAR